MGKRSLSGQKKRHKDTLKASLKHFNIPTESWKQIAQNRAKWRGLIRRGAGEYEAKRISEVEQIRAQRKARAKASPTELSSTDLSVRSHAWVDYIDQIMVQKDIYLCLFGFICFSFLLVSGKGC